MKKVLFAIFAVGMLFVACTKEETVVTNAECSFTLNNVSYPTGKMNFNTTSSGYFFEGFSYNSTDTAVVIFTLPKKDVGTYTQTTAPLYYDLFFSSDADSTCTSKIVITSATDKIIKGTFEGKTGFMSSYYTITKGSFVAVYNSALTLKKK